jgi:hypothetical protein
VTEEDKPEKDNPKKDKGPWWRQIATWLTVLGLFVTLFFNTLAVRQGAQQAKEGRESEQIGLLTTLNDRATAAEDRLNAFKLPQRQCRAHLQGTLAGRLSGAALLAAMDGYEYLAWLFNHGRLEKSARDLIGHRMIAGWRLANRFLPSDTLRATYPQLWTFYDKTPPKARGVDACA